MKLSKLYTNHPELFRPIRFNSGLNVVMATIRLPENLDKDTHNLGKSTLGLLIDFCLLAEKDDELFLFKHFEKFSSFEFYLELELFDKKFVTIRRTLSKQTKIDLALHDQGLQDFTMRADYVWSHTNLGIDRAKAVLDGLLNLDTLGDENYRKFLGYLFRTQEDYQNVFKLKKFSLGKHVYWKPFLAHILGLDAELVQSHYQTEDQIKVLENDSNYLRSEIGAFAEDLGRLEGLISLKQSELISLNSKVESLDFSGIDALRTKELVNETNESISALNVRRYSMLQDRRKMVNALEVDRALFSPEKAKAIFQEAGVLFGGQIKKDFEKLLAFNKAITEERTQFLKQDIKAIDREIEKIELELEGLTQSRNSTISFLGEDELFEKFREATFQIAALKADIFVLERQRGFFERLQGLKDELAHLSIEKDRIQKLIEKNVAFVQRHNATEVFSMIRKYFNEIVHDVTSSNGLLSVKVNEYGHLEFHAEIVDDKGSITSADKGHTYRKILCVAFDMAVVRAYIDKNFPRTLYHDGVFESLDDRIKKNLLGVVRKYTDIGIQQTITLIDSDLPRGIDGESGEVFEESEVILLLHDQGKEGRLFKMDGW